MSKEINSLGRAMFTHIFRSFDCFFFNFCFYCIALQNRRTIFYFSTQVESNKKYKTKKFLIFFLINKNVLANVFQKFNKQKHKKDEKMKNK